MDGEVEHIAAPNLKAFDEQTLRNTLEAIEKYAKENANPFTVLPYMRSYVLSSISVRQRLVKYSHTPPEWKDSWPALPWILRKVILPYMLAMRYSGYIFWIPRSSRTHQLILGTGNTRLTLCRKVTAS